MSRELNTPQEMAQRMAYVLHLFLLAGGVMVGLAGGFSGIVMRCVFGILMFAGGVALRYMGMRYLEFARLEKCFPTGTATGESHVADLIEELYELFERLENQEMEPRERQRLRKRILNLLRQDERLTEHYRRRLTNRHPYLLNAL